MADQLKYSDMLKQACLSSKDKLADSDIAEEQITQEDKALFASAPEVPHGERTTRVKTTKDKTTKLNAQIHAMNGFSAIEQLKFLRATKLLLHVVNSGEFQKWFLQSELKFTERTAGGKTYSNQELYDYIVSGSDQLDVNKDFDIDIDVTLYTPRWPLSKVCGYTNPGTRRTWINERFFAKYDFAAIANNIIHEYCHKLGFDHFKDWDTSVPYQVGNMVEKLARAQVSQLHEPLEGWLDSLPQIIFDNGGQPIDIEAIKREASSQAMATTSRKTCVLQ